MPIGKLKNRQAGQLDQLSARVGSKFTLRLQDPTYYLLRERSVESAYYLMTMHRIKSVDRLQTAEHAVMAGADCVPVLGRASLPQRTHHGHC